MIATLSYIPSAYNISWIHVRKHEISNPCHTSLALHSIPIILAAYAQSQNQERRLSRLLRAALIQIIYRVGLGTHFAGVSEAARGHRKRAAAEARMQAKALPKQAAQMICADTVRVSLIQDHFREVADAANTSHSLRISGNAQSAPCCQSFSTFRSEDCSSCDPRLL